MLHILQETQHAYIHNCIIIKIREANLKEPININLSGCKAGLVLNSIVSHQRRAVNDPPPFLGIERQENSRNITRELLQQHSYEENCDIIAVPII